jgi:hypothetical protein
VVGGKPQDFFHFIRVHGAMGFKHGEMVWQLILHLCVYNISHDKGFPWDTVQQTPQAQAVSAGVQRMFYHKVVHVNR